MAKKSALPAFLARPMCAHARAHTCSVACTHKCCCCVCWGGAAAGQRRVRGVQVVANKRVNHFFNDLHQPRDVPPSDVMGKHIRPVTPPHLRPQQNPAAANRKYDYLSRTCACMSTWMASDWGREMTEIHFPSQ